MDGLLSIWNLFSGTLKFAVELPPPKLIKEVREFNFLDDGNSSGGDSITRSLGESEEFETIEREDTVEGNCNRKISITSIFSSLWLLGSPNAAVEAEIGGCRSTQQSDCWALLPSGIREFGLHPAREWRCAYSRCI